MVCCDLPAFSDLLGPCTNDVFTAYAHVRTEPECDIGHTRGKKNLGLVAQIYAGSLALLAFFCLWARGAVPPRDGTAWSTLYATWN